MAKFSIAPAVRDHIETLYDNTSDARKLHIPDVAAMYGLPLGCAVVSYLFGVRLRGIGEIISGVSVLTGLLFALIVYIFQLRLQVAADPRVVRGGRLTTLLDELFSNISYAVIVGLATSITAITAASLRNGEGQAPIWISALVIAAGIHLVLTVLMCMKRIREAYRTMTR